MYMFKINCQHIQLKKKLFKKTILIMEEGYG